MMSAVARTSTDDLRRLVELAQQGDREALEALYLLHFDRIYSYLHMSVGNRHDAEDLTTQTFLKMLEAIGRFRWQSAPFSAWLFRIAHNLAMDHFRASRRWQPEEEVPEPEGATESSAEDAALQSIGRKSMLELIENLSPGAAAGADAEVPLQLLERRGRHRARQVGGRGQVAAASRSRVTAEATPARLGSMLEAGIVGLPAAGKTTLFNVLTRAGVGPDFGKEHVGMAPIADERLGQLAAVVSAAKVTPAAARITDVPGTGPQLLGQPAPR